MTKHPYGLRLDLFGAPDVDGGGRPANGATVQKLADYAERARLEGWDGVFLAYRAPGNRMGFEKWGAWGAYEVAGFLMWVVGRLVD